MKSVSTQTPNMGCAASGMEHLRTQLQLLLTDLQEVRKVTGGRGVRLHSLEKTVHRSYKALDTIGAAIEGLEREIEASLEDLSDLDDVYLSLLNKHERLDEAGHQLYQKVHMQDLYMGKMNDLDHRQQIELTSARFLRDEMREEKEKKEEELGLAKQRLDNQNMDFYKQFEGLKTDVKRHHHEARPLIHELDTCDKASLSRLKYFTRSDFISSEDMEKTMKLIKYMEYASQHRQMFDEVGDLEFDMRNSEKALEFKVSQVKAKLSKIESLERELSDTQGVFRETNGSYLKSVPRCVDLTDNHHHLQGETNSSKSWSDEEEDIDDEHTHIGGMGLHRCIKITDIHLHLQDNGESDITEEEGFIGMNSTQNEKDIEKSEDANVKLWKQNEEEEEQKDDEEDETDTDVEENEVLTSELKPLLNTGNPQTLGMEGVSVSDKRMSSIRRGLARDASGSTTFLKSAQTTGLRSTGSSSTFRTTSARKQK
ncbi:paramyosin-like [Haliotis asinina]|uniref:paramyosin-like n=1 Tax=Haliotis asinina TaxID=109174 RepID=UPI0035319D13